MRIDGFNYSHGVSDVAIFQVVNFPLVRDFNGIGFHYQIFVREDYGMSIWMWSYLPIFIRFGGVDEESSGRVGGGLRDIILLFFILFFFRFFVFLYFSCFFLLFLCL